MLDIIEGWSLIPFNLPNTLTGIYRSLCTMLIQSIYVRLQWVTPGFVRNVNQIVRGATVSPMTRVGTFQRLMPGATTIIHWKLPYIFLYRSDFLGLQFLLIYNRNGEKVIFLFFQMLFL